MWESERAASYRVHINYCYFDKLSLHTLLKVFTEWSWVVWYASSTLYTFCSFCFYLKSSIHSIGIRHENLEFTTKSLFCHLKLCKAPNIKCHSHSTWITILNMSTFSLAFKNSHACWFRKNHETIQNKLHFKHIFVRLRCKLSISMDYSCNLCDEQCKCLRMKCARVVTFCIKS